MMQVVGTKPKDLELLKAVQQEGRAAFPTAQPLPLAVQVSSVLTVKQVTWATLARI